MVVAGWIITGVGYHWVAGWVKPVECTVSSLLTGVAVVEPPVVFVV